MISDAIISTYTCFVHDTQTYVVGDSQAMCRKCLQDRIDALRNVTKRPEDAYEIEHDRGERLNPTESSASKAVWWVSIAIAVSLVSLFFGAIGYELAHDCAFTIDRLNGGC